MKRIFAAGCVSFLLLCSAATPLAALTPTYTITGAYKSSQYHQNINAITKTGDIAFDTVAAALSQLDYHEGNSKNDFNGENAGGTKNYTEYNRAFGTIGGSYSYAWCAAFVSWCLDVAGAKDSAGGKFTSCTLWVEKLQQLGLYSTRASGYTPKAGDLIFFRSAGVSRVSDHVGIVRFVKGGRVYTVEGNSSNKVSLRDYALTDTYIVGYGKPKYGGTPLAKSALSLEDTAAGLYTVTNDFVNVRASSSASSAKLGTLSRGALVEILEIKNGFGKITYNGKTAYISLDYADFTTPVFYTVTYTAESAKNCPPAHSYFSFEAVAASGTVPTREGYTFLYWVASDGKVYKSGDALPQGNLGLTAVFEAIPVIEEEPPQAPSAPNTAPPVSPPTADSGMSDTGSLGENLPQNVPQSTAKAAVEAGTVSGVLAASVSLWWYARKFLMI